MEKRKAQTKLENGKWLVTPIGQITEDFEFPEPPAGARSAIIDLGQITYINSTGVRSWLTWSKSLAAPGRGPLELVLARAPLSFLRLMEMIHDMIPPTGVLASYYCSHSCLDCGKICHVEIQNSADSGLAASGLGGSLPPCADCSSETELEMPHSFYESLSRFAPKRSA